MDSVDAAPSRAAHRLYCHFVWPTLSRIPLISRNAADVVERHLIALCRRLDAEPLCVRAFSDRVHLLARLNPGHSPAVLIGRLKEGSEAAIQDAGHTVRWGRGYAAATVSGSEVRAVMRRIHRLANRPRPGTCDGGPRDRPLRTPRTGSGAPTVSVDGILPAR